MKKCENTQQRVIISISCVEHQPAPYTVSPILVKCHISIPRENVRKPMVLKQHFQKQPPEVSYKERCSWKFCKILKKTPVPEPLFNKVAGLRLAILLKKRLWHSCFHVNFAKFLRTPLQNTSCGCFCIFENYFSKAYC